MHSIHNNSFNKFFCLIICMFDLYPLFFNALSTGVTNEKILSFRYLIEFQLQFFPNILCRQYLKAKDPSESNFN